MIENQPMITEVFLGYLFYTSSYILDGVHCKAISQLKPTRVHAIHEVLQKRLTDEDIFHGATARLARSELNLSRKLRVVNDNTDESDAFLVNELLSAFLPENGTEISKNNHTVLTLTEAKREANTGSSGNSTGSTSSTVKEEESANIAEYDTDEDNSSNREKGEEDECTILPQFSCDYDDGNTCWYNREIGDSITLAINVSSPNEEQYVVQWHKVYKSKIPGRNVKMKLEPDRCPWNAVIGSGGMELRLSPLTDSDMDYNSFFAKIMTASGGSGQKSFKTVKELIFRIDITPIDMGVVYAGEEVVINIENFITLPAKGLSFQWSVEKKNEKLGLLPSNMKVSRSGKTVTIKELKKEQEGSLSCAVYSSSSLCIAKRRFLIRKPKPELRRSLTIKAQHDISDNLAFLQSRNRREISKNFPDHDAFVQPNQVLDLNYRFLRPLEYAPLQSSYRAIGYNSRSRRQQDNVHDSAEISEDDEEGTLFNTIPKEVHYVQPTIRLFTHESLERSANQEGEHDVIYNCSSNFDCGPKASCILPPPDGNSKMQQKYCRCNPEYQGDGWRCHKPSSYHHRDKRIKRNVATSKRQIGANVVPGQALAMAALPQAFGSVQGRIPAPYPFQQPPPNPMQIANAPINKLAQDLGSAAQLDDDTNTEAQLTFPPFDDEESYLLAKCDTREMCSPHASCVRASRLPARCKCEPGHRGNGIFCWEIPDYIPSDLEVGEIVLREAEKI